MTRSQSLIEDIKNLHVKYEELESRHETLSTTHEKLSYDYLQSKQDLEKLRRLMKIFKMKTSHFAPNRSVPLRKDLNHHVLNALSVTTLLLLLSVLLLLLLKYLQLLKW